MLKRGLILIAHGSLNAESNVQIGKLVSRLVGLVPNQYGMINYAFLEFAKPAMTDVLNEQISHDMSEIVIFPYFLTNGNHVTQDIPKLVHDVAVLNPQVKFNILPPFGSNAGIADLIATLL